MFRRWFAPPSAAAVDADTRPGGEPGDSAETATVRGIIGRLEAMPPEHARFVACAAYVVARAANADMIITDDETAYMERALREYGGLDEAQAALVVEMAKLQARAVGGTEDYLVTREFRSVSTPEQRLRILRACFAVTAVDDSISAEESAVVDEIASELGVEAAELAALRGEFTDRFAAIRAMRARTGGLMQAPADVGENRVG
ncbi:MAG TPA: TerB family tellurite resistance protein [Candidatus Dormibacteraeota bacterium]|nr:TerB family tellurite resistance protein [Candidatus Dormibacteraeota bacterium]